MRRVLYRVGEYGEHFMHEVMVPYRVVVNSLCLLR